MGVKELLIPVEQDKRDPITVGIGVGETIMVKQGPATVHVELAYLQDCLDAMIVAAGAIKQTRRSAERRQGR